MTAPPPGARSQTTSEAKVLLVVNDLRAKGKQIPRAISEIPDFPFSTYSALCESIARHQVLLQRFSSNYENGIFSLLASPSERALSTFFTGLAFLLPLGSVVLAFVHSWWWLLGTLGLFAGLSRGKRLYNRVILSSAMRSEVVFSFLYFTQQVCVTSTDFKESFYWNREP